MPVIQDPNQKPKILGQEEGSTSANFQSGGFGGVKPGATSGRFQNVRALLDANKKSNIAGGIVNQVQGQAQETQAKAQETAQKANEAIKQNFNQYTGGQTAEQAKAQAQQTVDAAATNGNVDPNAIAAFQGAQGSQWGAGAADFSEQAREAQRLAGIGRNATTEEGRMGLLQQFNKAPTYTQGQRRLDQLLLQGNKAEQQRLNQLRNLGGQTQAQIAEAQSGVNQNLSTSKTQAQELQDYVKNYLSEKIGGVSKGIGDQVTAANEKVGQDYQNTLNKFTQGDYETLQSLGIDPNQRTYGLSNTDLARFVSKELPQATMQNILSKDQAASINALRNLAGSNQAALADQLKAQFGENLQAGDFQGYKGSLDKGGLAGALSANKAAYESEFNPLKQAQDFDTNKLSDLNARIPRIEALLAKRSQVNPFDEKTAMSQAETDELSRLLEGHVSQQGDTFYGTAEQNFLGELKNQRGYAQDALNKTNASMADLEKRFGGKLLGGGFKSQAEQERAIIDRMTAAGLGPSVRPEFGWEY